MIGERLLIFGNCGAGKTYLAARISRQYSIQLLSLDEIYWRDDSCTRARSSKWGCRQIKELSSKYSWVIEGVYSHLIKLAVPRATTSIWLDYSYESCLENIRIRGELSNPYTLSRVEEYYTRNTGSSWKSHNQIFQDFNGKKLRITSKGMMSGLIKGIEALC